MINGIIRSQIKLLKESALELKQTKSLTALGLLVAMNIVVGTLFIEIGPNLRIGFAFLVVGICALYYGPIATGCVGIIADILKYLIRPSGVFFLGFTLNEFLSGFIVGIILYKKPVTIKKVFLARLLVVIIVNIVLTPIWLSVLYGKGFIFYVSTRIFKNMILLPIETVILYYLLKATERVKIK